MSVRSLGLALALVTGALTASVAAGHAVLQRAEPRVESTLKRPPEEVRLYFSERLEPAYSSVRVLNERDTQVDRRDSRVDRSNPIMLRVTLPLLPAGTYKVVWRVLSVSNKSAGVIIKFGPADLVRRIEKPINYREALLKSLIRDRLEIVSKTLVGLSSCPTTSSASMPRNVR